MTISSTQNIPGYFNYSGYGQAGEVRRSNQLVPVKPAQITRAEETVFGELVESMFQDNNEEENSRARTDLPLSSDYVDDPRKLLFARGSLKQLQYA